MKLLLASNNPGKLRQLARLLQGLPIEVLRPADLGLTREVEETGATYSANAALKALAFARASGLYAMGDDSGLEIPRLGFWPGVHSVRFAGPDVPQPTRQALILARVETLPPGERQARFVGVVALAVPTRVLVEAVGTLSGQIVAPRRNEGFGYDPIFQPEGSPLTLAELPPAEADRISHRGIALRELIPFLDALARA